MMKRMLAMFLVLVMVVSVLPLDAFAATYGRDMGWEYSVITEKTGGGYNMTNPTGSNHLGSHVTVTYNNNGTSTNWTEGTLYNNVLSSTQSDATVTIACDFGYYITEIIVACGDNRVNPFNCRTTGSESAYGLALPESSVPTTFVLDMNDLYAMTDHTSRDEDYFLMVEIAPLPGSVYVGYDAGTAGTTDITAYPVDANASVPSATKNGEFATWGYNVADFTEAPAHTVLGISAEAEAQANAAGYSFAGWQLTYYNDYTASNNAFANPNGVGMDNVREGSTASVYTHALLTAIWAPMITINVQKVWNDADNQDGLRPADLDVHLLAGTEHTGDVLTLNEANGWKGSWLVPSVDENGNTIQYFAEEELIDGYEASAPTITTSSDGKTISYLFKNTHTPGTTDISVLKNWNDSYNQDGLRTESIVAILKANGTEVARVTLNTGNRWFHTWTDMPTHANGQRIEYTIEEASIPTGYRVEYIHGTQTGLFEIVNIHDTYKTSVTAQKVWDDADDQDGKRPASIQVQLYANAVAYGDPVTLNAANGWSYKWTNLDQKASGTDIVYTVKEVTEHVNYTTKVVVTKSGSANGSYAYTATITNSYTPEVTTLTVNKVWNDANNQDGIRPAAITVILYANGTEKERVQLTAKDNWTYKFENLPKYDDGELIAYTVDEVEVTGYIKSVNGFTITNTHTPAVTTVTVEKEWADDNDAQGLRPNSVTVHLLANGQHTGKKITLNASNGWKYTWSDLPENASGNAIEYSVLEETPAALDADAPRYVPSYRFENGKFIITNTLTNDETAITVEKVWDDSNNRYESRPEEITVILYKTVNGVKTEVTRKTTSAAHHWALSFANLPRYEDVNGTSYEIVYSVEEIVPDGYTAKVSADTNEGIEGVFIITNTYNVERIEIPVSKKWDDANNQDGIRPGGIVVDLYYNSGNGWLYTGKSLTLNEAIGWDGVFTGILKEYDNQDIQYYVVEQPADGYTIKITGDPENPAGGFVITNIHEPETIDIPVKKVWNDANNQDGYRPTSIKVNLLANGTKVAELELNAGNLGQSVFEDLPKYANGVEIVYTVEEQAFTHSNQYTASVTGTAETGFTITNTHEIETIDLVINKYWNDDDDRDLLRPDSIKLWLVQSGGTDNPEQALSVELTAENGWTTTVKDLPKNYNGQRIIYTVLEILQDGYNVAYKYTSDGNKTTVEITNTHISDNVTVAVEKVWDDGDNRDGIRPESITVTLIANGTATDKTLTLNAEGNWVGEWTGLDKWYVDGEGVRKEIEYTVEEAPVEGYTPSITIDSKVGIVRIITNSHEPETTTVVVNKTWDDQNNAAGIRAENVKVQLYANGKPLGNPVVLDADNGWKNTWEGLYVNKNGEPIKYTVQEIDVPDKYTANYMDPVVTESDDADKDPILTLTVCNKLTNDPGNGGGNNDNPPPTADLFDLPLRAMMFVASAAALAVLILTDKKPRRGHYAR